MRVRLRLFGMLKEVAGRADDLVELPEGALISDLLEKCGSAAPKLKQFFPVIAIALNQEYASAQSILRDQDEVALIPPVSGGSGQTVVPRAGSARVALVRETIDAAWLLSQIKHPEDGAVAVFDGIVRNQTRGRRTLYLDYEAYEEMALKQMDGLIAEALGKFPIRDARIVHRLGRLDIGETSVLIVVASAHRAAAFDACRWLIDTLKRTVPIWKKEHFEDGAVWADGEPFPPELAPDRNLPASGESK